MQRKIPLPITNVELVGQDVKDLAEKLRARFPGWAKLPTQVSENPYMAVAAVAVHPGILMDSLKFGMVADIRNFAGCYMRYPDQVIDALALVRVLVKKAREQDTKAQVKNANTQAGRVREFFRMNPYLVKKSGKFVCPDKLTAADYQTDRRTLRPCVEYVSVNDPQVYDKDLAGLVFGSNYNLKHVESVKSARQSLSSSKGKN